MAMSKRCSLLGMIALLLMATACTTAPRGGEEEAATVRELRAAEDLLQSPEVLAAIRLEVGALQKIGPLLERGAEAGNLRELHELADLSEDPIGEIQKRHGLPNDLPSLNREEPLYLLITKSGNEEFFRAATLGMPTEESEWPAFIGLRALLPTNSPAALGEEFRPWVEEMKASGAVKGAELYEGPGFLRVELALRNRGGATAEEGQRWLQSQNLERVMPPRGVEYRPTAAYLAFVEQEAPTGIWMPLESLAALGALEQQGRFERDYRYVGPAGKPRFFLEGVARMAGTSLMVDPVSAENEDVTILFTPEESGAMIVDGYLSRTALGSRVAAMVESPVMLPGANTANRFLELSWAANLEGLKGATVKPYWALLEEEESQDDWGGFDAGASGTSSLLRSSREAMFSSLAAGLQYPWTTVGMAMEEMEAFFPRPRAMALEGFAISDAGAGGFPVGAVAVALFENTAENRMSIEQLLGMANMAVPLAFDASLVEREDNYLELRLALGAELNKLFSSMQGPVQIGAMRASVDLAPLLYMLQGMAPNAEGLDLFENFHVRTLSTPEYTAMRATLGAPDAREAREVEGAAAPLTDPTYRCRTEFAGAAQRHLGDLRTNASVEIEKWAREVRELSERCMGDDEAMQAWVEARIARAEEIGAKIP